MSRCFEGLNGYYLKILPKPPEEFLEEMRDFGWKDGQFVEWDNENEKLIFFDSVGEYSDYKFYKSDTMMRQLESTNKISLEEYRKRMRENDYNPMLVIEQINLFNLGKSKKRPAGLMSKLKKLGWKEGQFVYWDGKLKFFDTHEKFREYMCERTARIMKRLKPSHIINWKNFWKIDADIEMSVDALELNIK